MSENREQRKRMSGLSVFQTPIKFRSVAVKSTSKPTRFLTRNTIHPNEVFFGNSNSEVQSESAVKFGIWDVSKNVHSNELQNQNTNDDMFDSEKSSDADSDSETTASSSENEATDFFGLHSKSKPAIIKPARKIYSKFVEKIQEFNNSGRGPAKSHSSSNGQIVSNSSSESESESDSINDSDNESQILNANPTEDNEARQNAEIRQKSDEIKKLKLEIENIKKNHEQEIMAKDREKFEAVREKNAYIRHKYEELNDLKLQIGNFKTEHGNEIADLKGKLELQSANIQKLERKLAQNADETKRRNLALVKLQAKNQVVNSMTNEYQEFFVETLASLLPEAIEVDEQ